MRDSQMPTIVEDKLYPRRTRGADEIQAIRLSDHSSNESPDLGPPPVAHFDYEDPVKNLSPLINKVSPKKPAASSNEDDELPASLSVNLETRRRRRDGQSRLEIRRHSLVPPSQSPAKPEAGDSSSILRTGAKRKLSDRETDKPIKPPSKGDFTFSRKATTGDVKAVGESAARDVENPAATELAEHVASSPKPARKVLGDKSVNFSPRKTTSAMQEKPEKAKPDKAMSSRLQESRDSAATTRRRRVSSIPLPSPPRESVLDTIEIAPPVDSVPATGDPPPETPAAPPDLFSPTPSEPSAKPLEGRGDTPPPPDVSSLSSTADIGGTRPSRRVRSAVNYAEPSLISKIRRPDKKMVDAVSGLQDPRRAMGASAERKAARSAVAIKMEPEDDAAEDHSWKDLPHATSCDRRAEEPTSPLHRKSEGDPEPATATDDIMSAPEAATAAAIDDGKPSASSATISALMAAAGSRNKRRHSNQPQPLGTDIEPVDAATKKLEEMDLYDFKESSSPYSTDNSSFGVEGEPTRKPGRPRSSGHRRHSSVPKNITATVVDDGRSDRGMARGERTASRRRSMML